MKDLYSILELPTNANGSTIDKSYRKLAFRYHPDRNRGDSDSESKFRDIAEAYEILKDPQKRGIYDKFGYETVSESSDAIDPVALFQSLFNVDFTRELQSDIFFFSDLSSLPFDRKNKRVYEVECSLEELYKGTKKEFAITSRIKEGSKTTNYFINVKPGSRDNDNVIVREGGDYTDSGVQDLAICIKELAHERFRRQGDDLYVSQEISLADALCGPTIALDRFGEILKIQISDIVKPNSLYQVFGKGMPTKKGPSLTEDISDISECGNLILDLDIVFPEELSDERKGYLKQILGSMKQSGASKIPADAVVTSAYFLQNKQDALKTLMNAEEEEGTGCLQQ